MKDSNKGIEIFESAEALQDSFGKTQHFAEKNKNLIFGVLAAIALAIVAVFGYNYYIGNLETEAEKQLFPAVFYLEKDSVDKALNGDNVTTEGLVAVAENYGLTKAGNLAKFYAGIGFMKKAEFDKAIKHLEGFSANDLLIQARAYCLIGDAYMEKNDAAKAADFYKKAAEYKPNEQFSPTYYLKLAGACEQKGDINAANEAYDKIIKDFPESPSVDVAKKLKARNGVY